MNKYALISVYKKTNLIPLARMLVNKKIKIISTGGTADYLRKNKVPVIPIEQITQNPESFDGRMKTISFQILSGILYDRTKTTHLQEAKALNVPQIDFVVCNFYPFQEKPGIEMIDVGGPTMVRAAAKNYESVTVLTDPADYEIVIDELKTLEKTSIETRKQLAAKAFSYVSWLDALINNYFQKETGGAEKTITLRHSKLLRYGENPQQKGIFYGNDDNDQLGLEKFKRIQGKETSFNNYLDLDGGLAAMSLLGTRNPCCIILKHTNPCGAATAETIEEAFQKAWFEGDPLAAFGGVILMNRPVSGELAKQMLADKKFFEIIAAPSFSKDAIEILSQKTKLQLLENKFLEKPFLSKYDEIKTVRGGFLLQDIDTHIIDEKKLSYVTKIKPTKKQLEDLIFAWNLCQVSKSNCVVAVKDRVLLASGVGQQDRKRCCELCVSKAIKSLEGAVAATDGFFPFRDGPDILIKAGIKAIIQPGGSIRDQQTIDACNEAGIAMVFTGVRCFKH